MKISNSEIILELIKENLEEIRQNTNHRKEVTQFILTIGGAIGVIANTESIKLTQSQNTFIAFIAIAVGVFGVFFTRKLHERQLWYSGRIKILYQGLDKLQEDLGISEIYEEHQRKHRKEHPILSRIFVNVLWIIINLSVALLGIGILFLNRS